ncbi:hypothetical protein NEIPOLOT_00462 [Neisseria polysaccharea ATCC 43768]|nr:hypothetical protein NEIPOLOT_00462 [Neisseria polysaccharea ATCC 43768]
MRNTAYGQRAAGRGRIAAAQAAHGGMPLQILAVGGIRENLPHNPALMRILPFGAAGQTAGVHIMVAVGADIGIRPQAFGIAQDTLADLLKCRRFKHV